MATSQFYDLARVTVVGTPGTGAITLGPAIYGFLTFAQAGVVEGAVTTYAINDGAQSEIGQGTYTASSNTLTRNLVYSSTNGGIGGSKISVSALAQVFITIAAEDFNADAGVGSIAQLRALASGASVNVLGYYTPGDGGGGLFYYNVASTATDNGGTVIAPNSGVGRWLRIAVANVFTPRMFGARADGSSDTGFIQNAINAIAVLGGTLWMDTVYTVGGAVNANGLSLVNLLSGVNIDGPGGFKLANNTNVIAATFTATCASTTMTVSAVSFGTIAANQFLSGQGFAAGTKVVTQLGGTPGGAGTYQLNTSNTVGSGVTLNSCARMVEMIGSYTPAVVNNTTYKNFLLDYNGANNCAGQTIWSFNSVVTVNVGTNIVFDGVRFRNNCGSNSIVLGVRQANPVMSQAVVTNCTFENDGDRVNSASLDYSTIFAICSGLVVTGSTFALGPLVNGAALEVYGTDLSITGNNISGYQSTMNVVALANQTTSNVNFAANTLDVSNGPVLWNLDFTSRLRNINIVGNSCNIFISAPGGPYFVDATNEITSGSEIDDLNIIGNSYTNYNFSDITRTSAGIMVSSCQSLKIIGNTIQGVPGIGISITRTLDPVTIDISDNTLLNIGYCNTSSLKVGIELGGAGTTGTLSIQDNTINPIAGYTMTSGINNALSVTTGIIQNNVITGATTPVINSGTGVVSITSPASSGTLALTSTPASSIVVGTTTVGSGVSNGLLYDTSGGLLGVVASANNSVLVTNGSGVLSLSTTLPSNITLNTPIITGSTTPSIPAGVIGFNSNQLNFGDGSSNHVLVSLDQTQTLTNKTLNTPTAVGGSLTALTTLALRDTSAAFDVTIAAVSGTPLTAGRTLTISMGNAAHSLLLSSTASVITFPAVATYTLIGSGDTGTVTNTMLANSSVTINGTAISLGASGTVTAAAGTLTGTTLASNVVSSSLTSLGTITSLVATTISSPTYNSPGTHTFQSNGGTFAGSISTSQQWALGANITPDSLLTLNSNTGASVTSVSTPQLHLIGPDGANAGLAVHAYGSPVRMEIYQANGTQATKTATSSSASIFSFNGYGWDTAAYGLGGAFQFVPSVTWTAANHGTALNFLTTPGGSTSTAVAVTFQASGGLSVGAAAIAADPGIGSLNVSNGLSVGTTQTPVAGQIYINNAAFMIRTKTSFTSGAAAQLGTLTNAPVAGNPTKWIAIDDNGTTRQIPAW